MNNQLKEVTAYTDGCCKGNPGIGGWGYILMYGDVKREDFHGEKDTTNNRMELMAVIKCLEALKFKCRVTIHTDSQYVKRGISEWIHGWKRNGWNTKGNKPVKNKDLWKELDELANKHVISWKWVKAHNGNFYNERADELANLGYLKVK